MYSRIIILAGVTLLSGCTIWNSDQPKDFNSLYKEHITSEIDNLKQTAEKLGYLGNFEVIGTIRALADIPTVFSGGVYSRYEGVIHNYGLSQDSSITLKNPHISYEMLLASGSLKANEASMITRGGDSYLRYSGLVGYGFFDDSIAQILSKYEKTWLSITEQDILDTLSGATEEDMMAYHLSQSLARMRLEDLERYLIDYPIWKEVESLGEKDGLISFRVELSMDSILALADDFALKSTGKKLDENARMSLKADLDSQKIQGTIGYNPKNPKYVRFDIDVISGDGSRASIIFSRLDGKTDFITRSSGSTLEFSLTKENFGYALSGKIGNNNENIILDARLSLGEKRSLILDASLSAPSQGVSIKIKHAQNRDGSFGGNIDAGIGNLNWIGKLSSEKTLESLKVQGAVIGSNLNLDLTPGTGGLARGPLTLKNGNDTIINALVGLGISPEKFELILDIINPETPEISSRAEISVTGKKQKTSKVIDIPNNTRPFREISDEIGKLYPTEDIWTEVVPGDLTEEPPPLNSLGQ